MKPKTEKLTTIIQVNKTTAMQLKKLAFELFDTNNYNKTYDEIITEMHNRLSK